MQYCLVLLKVILVFLIRVSIDLSVDVGVVCIHCGSVIFL